MHARQKLNAAALNGSALLAAAIGYLADSLAAGLVALSLLLASNMVSGAIRLRPKR